VRCASASPSGIYSFAIRHPRRETQPAVFGRQRQAFLPLHHIWCYSPALWPGIPSLRSASNNSKRLTVGRLGDWEIGRRWASSFSRVFWNPKDIPTQNAICDFRMEYKDISERVAFLAQEIRDLRQMNASYSKQSEGSQRTSRASHEERELRLRQIKEELSKLMLKPTREQ